LNPMRRLKISKVTVNMGVGEAGERLAKGVQLLEELTGQKPVHTIAKRTIQPFGIRKGLAIGCKVTLRGEKAMKFLRDAFAAVDNRIKASNFDEQGNFAFGIREHIDLPGVKYDPMVGIYGMDVCVAIERPGYRVKHRKLKKSKVGKKHLVTKEEAINFIKETFNVEVEA